MTPCSNPRPKARGLNGDESVYDHDAPEFCECGSRMDSHTARKKTVVFTHIIDAYDRGGRFGEDVLSVRCRCCRKVWKNEAEFSRKRIGDEPCPARRAGRDEA